MRKVREILPGYSEDRTAKQGKEQEEEQGGELCWESIE